MPAETPVPDYRLQTQHVVRRPRRLLSHCRTAALLCIAVVFLDVQVTSLRGSLGLTSLLEILLPLWGTIALVAASLVGHLRPSDKLWLCGSGLVYLLTVAWVILLPRIVS